MDFMAFMGLTQDRLYNISQSAIKQNCGYASIVRLMYALCWVLSVQVWQWDELYRGPLIQNNNNNNNNNNQFNFEAADDLSTIDIILYLSVMPCCWSRTTIYGSPSIPIEIRFLKIRIVRYNMYVYWYVRIPWCIWIASYMPTAIYTVGSLGNPAPEHCSLEISIGLLLPGWNVGPYSRERFAHRAVCSTANRCSRVRLAEHVTKVDLLSSRSRCRPTICSNTLYSK